MKKKNCSNSLKPVEILWKKLLNYVSEANYYSEFFEENKKKLNQDGMESKKFLIYINKHPKNKITSTIADNGLVVKAVDSQSRGPMFKTTRWLQGQLSLSQFQHW